MISEGAIGVVGAGLLARAATLAAASLVVLSTLARVAASGPVHGFIAGFVGVGVGVAIGVNGSTFAVGVGAGFAAGVGVGED
jgi:hypothetical protein